MKMFTALTTSIPQVIRSWKGAIAVWFMSLVPVAILAFPLKASLNSALGKSMITEKLADGIDVEVLADLGSALKSLISFFSAGLLVIIAFAFLMNAFLAGGMFKSVSEKESSLSVPDFFSASARNFWSFLVISVIFSIIILITGLISMFPLGYFIGNEPKAGGVFIRLLWVVVPFVVLLLILILAADYSRAWQVSADKPAPFRAIGFGFSRTFRTFWSSMPLMIIVLIVQVLFTVIVFTVLSKIKPATGPGLLLFSVLTQLLFFFKILLKMWRFGSVTRLKQLSDISPEPKTPVEFSAYEAGNN